MSDKTEWYDYRAIDSRNAIISIVSGPRSIGKTYGAKLRGIKEAVQAGKQTMWVRRTKTELTPAKSGFFDSVAGAYPGFDFKTDGDTGLMRLEGGLWKPAIRFVSLSTAYQHKGTEFPEVERIVYDECFAEPRSMSDPASGYLPDEIEKLRSLLVTVNRSRVRANGRLRVKVLLLGNALRLDNPYFLEWGFDGEHEWQKGRDTGGDVVLHLVDSSRYERRVGESIYGRVLGTRAIDYAMGDYFLPDGGYVIEQRPPDSRPFATLVTMRGDFGLWRDPHYERMYVTPGALSSKDSPVVAFEPMAVRPGVALAEGSTYWRKEARRHYRRGSMFFVTQGAMLARQALAR